MSRQIRIVRYKHSIRAIADDAFGHNLVQQYCKKNLFKPAGSPATALNPYAAPVVDELGDLFYIECESRRTTILTKVLEKEFVAWLGKEGIKCTFEERTAFPGKAVVFDNHTLTLMEPPDGKYAWQNTAAILIAEDDHNVFELQTGKGKSIAAEKGAIRRGVITAFITKPAYMPKWVGDIESGLGLVVDQDFVVIDSVSKLVKIVTDGGDQETKAYLISSYCLDNYIHRWAESPDEYIDPDEILSSLGIGLCIYDEAHEVFRMQYWSVLAMAPNAILDLSATLLPDDPFLKDRYAERFPSDTRMNMDFNAYVDVIGLAFSMEDRKIAQRINRQPMYQHHVFESKVSKRKTTQLRYFDMLFRIIDKWYIRERQEGQKALVMLATRNMCTEFWDYCRQRLPDLDVQRYIEGDKYDTAKEADVIISTPGKSGTGVDYVGLVLNVIAVSVNASQKSMQMLGRTRDSCIARWGIHPKVVYPICTDILKQVVYYNRRRKLLSGRVNSMITMNSGIVI